MNPQEIKITLKSIKDIVKRLEKQIKGVNPKEGVGTCPMCSKEEMYPTDDFRLFECKNCYVKVTKVAICMYCYGAIVGYTESHYDNDIKFICAHCCNIPNLRVPPWK